MPPVVQGGQVVLMGTAGGGQPGAHVVQAVEMAPIGKAAPQTAGMQLVQAQAVPTAERAL